MTKAIVITGGSGGIGAASARLAAARGWSVAFNYAANTEGAERTVAEIKAAGGRAVALKGDVSVEADIVALFDAAADAFGRIDGLVNNAGTLGPVMPLAEMDVDRLRRVIEVNVLGAFLAAREAVRRMGTSRGGGGGSIVNISSAAARLGAGGERVDYAGTKGAVESLHPRPRARARSRRHQGQRRQAGHHRNGPPRPGRTARPRRPGRCGHADGPGRHGRGSRGGGRLAPLRTGVLRHRCDPRRDRRTLRQGIAACVRPLPMLSSGMWAGRRGREGVS